MSKQLTRQSEKRVKKPKADRFDLRLEVSEKQAFQDAADLAGIPLSNWVRERLRRAAIKELEAAGYPIAFLMDFDLD